MKRLKVDKETCVYCGNCERVFKGMPDSAMGKGIVVPEWAETCFNGSEKMLLETCFLDAISVEEVAG